MYLPVPLTALNEVWYLDTCNLDRSQMSASSYKQLWINNSHTNLSTKQEIPSRINKSFF